MQAERGVRRQAPSGGERARARTPNTRWPSLMSALPEASSTSLKQPRSAPSERSTMHLSSRTLRWGDSPRVVQRVVLVVRLRRRHERRRHTIEFGPLVSVAVHALGIRAPDRYACCLVHDELADDHTLTHSSSRLCLLTENNTSPLTFSTRWPFSLIRKRTWASAKKPMPLVDASVGSCRVVQLESAVGEQASVKTPFLERAKMEVEEPFAVSPNSSELSLLASLSSSLNS